MNWLTNYVKPKLKAVLRTRETPDNLWQKCKGCGQLIFQKEFKANQYVCGHCDFHGRIGPKERFSLLFDDGEHSLVDIPKSQDDPLKFRDQKKYTDRLKESRAKTGDDDALKVAVGKIDGSDVVVSVQNFFFMGGSLSIGVGAGIIAAVEKAVEIGAPLVMITAAGGARMQEGILALMQLPRATVAVDMLREAGLPYIVVLADPTTGGVTASYAMLGDIHIAEPGALVGFAGPRVIENTIREKLPEGFQRAEYLKEHGMVDMVIHRHDLRKTLITTIALLTRDGEGPGARQAS